MKVVQTILDHRRNLILASCLILMAALWFFFLKEEKKQDNFFRFLSEPQEYMTGISIWNFTEQGRLKEYVSADYWAYLPETKKSTLKMPHLTVFKPDNSIWKIDAKQAKVKQPTLGSIEEIELSEDVVLQKLADATHPIKVETSVIRYQPKTQYAETEQLITLIRPDVTITSKGMRAFLDKNQVELLKDVKTSYNAE